jgi:asparaginyl-tRNA synthetase
LKREEDEKFLKVCHDQTQAQTYDALTLTTESTVQQTGNILELPSGKSAPDGHELQVDWWTVVGKAPGDTEAFSNQISEESGPDTLADQRHLVIRGETASNILKVRSALLDAFRKSYKQLSMVEVTPPCMVQTQVEVSHPSSSSSSSSSLSGPTTQSFFSWVLVRVAPPFSNSGTTERKPI